MKCLFSVAAVAVILHSAGMVRAEEEASEPTPGQVRTAAEAFDRGREAYKSEEYVEAAEQFESADSNASSAAALELAIRARDKAGQLDRAGTLAALAVVRYPSDANIQKFAPGVVQRAKQELFELDIKCSDPCDVTVAGKIAPGRRSTDRTVFVGPGKYAVRAGWSGDRSLSRQVEATPGGTSLLEFQTPADPIAVGPVPSPDAVSVEKNSDERPRSKSGVLPTPVFWVGAGLTAVMSGITVWSGIDTQNNPGPDKVRTACMSKDPSCQTLYQQGVDKQHRTNILIGVTASVGIATAVIGAFFTDWGSKKKSDASSDSARAGKSNDGFSVEPWVTVGGGASVGALGRF